MGKYLWQFRRNQLELIKIILTSKKSSNEAYENVYLYALESLDLGGTDCVLAAVDLVQALQIPSLEFIMKVTLLNNKDEVKNF